VLQPSAFFNSAATSDQLLLPLIVLQDGPISASSAARRASSARHLVAVHRTSGRGTGSPRPPACTANQGFLAFSRVRISWGFLGFSSNAFY
jgi:hypothetical protein